MTRRVMPRGGLVAERIGADDEFDNPWMIDLKPQDSTWGTGCVSFTDAEFTAAFVDAGLYEAVIEAAREAESLLLQAAKNVPAYDSRSVEAFHVLAAALRAFDEGHKP